MSRWFRFYDDAVNDPKVQRLPGEKFKAWINLLCIASQNDGVLPAVDDLAYVLRVTRDEMSILLDEFCDAGLIDPVEVRDAPMSYEPHNWKERQYISDTKDPTAAKRSKKYRAKKRDAAYRDRDATVTLTATRADTDTEQIDKIVVARASFTEGSKFLVSAFWKALGFSNPLEITPEYAGSDWRALDWERAGWTADLIDVETRRIGPGKPLTYYEKVFATAFAKRQAPLPVVEIKPAEKLTVTHGKINDNPRAGSLIGALDRAIAAIEAESHPALPADNLLRIPDRSVQRS